MRALSYMGVSLVGCVALVGVVLAGARDTQFAPTAAEKAAAANISERTLRSHIRFLADDLLEGRGPGTRGDQLAQRYIATEFESLGLAPVAPTGGWYQPVPLVGIDSRVPAQITLSKGSESVSLAFRRDFIAVSGVQKPTAAVDAEIVFVGYGIVAPEYQWDDYKDVDVRGKVLLMMNNDPAGDASLFAGKTRLYYGRWDYKYQIAAKKGAVGAIIIHTVPSAGYPWQVVETSWTGEQFELEADAEPRVAVKSWVTDESARKIAGLAQQDLDKLRAAAESRAFKPVPLGVRCRLDFTNTIRKQMSANVLGLLEGTDPQLKREWVVFSAHHDHLGLAESDRPGADRIYNGAVDNASGVAALLALAKAFAALPEPPRRSILFAAVAAEEQGLLGSKYLAAHPPVPPGYLAANLNIDGINILGRTRDLTVVGHGKSDLDQVVAAVATWQGRVTQPDQFPDRGFYYRSDQFSLAHIGVPAVYLDGGVDVIGRPPGWGKEQIEKWEATNYHQPSDEYSDDWNLSGAVEDIQLLFFAGARIAENVNLPKWTPGDEFESARKQALRSRP